MGLLDSITGAFSSSTTTTTPAGDTTTLPDLPDKAVFDNEKVTVIFVLGGPGAGKQVVPLS